MKGLKFRVWEEREKEYDTWSYILDDSGNLFRNAYGALIECDKKDYIIEQYTGLEDKNGKEIYEGDIVSVRNKNRKNEYDIGVVEFGKAAFRCPFLLGKYHSGQVEVIGNIHENADLMEKK